MCCWGGIFHANNAQAIVHTKGEIDGLSKPGTLAGETYPYVGAISIPGGDASLLVSPGLGDDTTVLCTATMLNASVIVTTHTCGYRVKQALLAGQPVLFSTENPAKTVGQGYDPARTSPISVVDHVFSTPIVGDEHDVGVIADTPSRMSVIKLDKPLLPKFAGYPARGDGSVWDVTSPSAVIPFVGYGAPTKGGYACPATDGYRRIAQLEGVGYSSWEDEFFVEPDERRNRQYRRDLPNGWEDVAARGDMGGPLFDPKAPGHITGMHSYGRLRTYPVCRTNLDPSDLGGNAGREIYLTFDTFFEGANAAWFEQILSQFDADGDGVPDDADNCLLLPNKLQEDADDDGIGDACDCPGAHPYKPPTCSTDADCGYVPGTWLANPCVAGRCAHLVDRDQDQVYDQCDACPFVADDQADSDGDGAGDACDCAGTQALASCTADARCGKGNACVDGWLGKPGLHCAQPIDSDGDSWPNACDNCKVVPNPTQADANLNGAGDACEKCPCSPAGTGDVDGDGVCESCDATMGDNGYCASFCATHPLDNCPDAPNPSQANCNGQWEALNGQPLRGDACDPTPCSYSDNYPALPKKDKCSAYAEPPRFVRVAFDAEMLAHDKHPAGFEYSVAPGKKLTSTVGARVCKCIYDNETDCMATCPPYAIHYDKPTSPWQRLALSKIPDDNAPIPTKPPTFSTSQFSNVPLYDPSEAVFGQASKPSPVMVDKGQGTVWADWDIKPLAPTTPADGPADAAQIKGVFWSHVTDVTNLKNDTAAKTYYLERSNNYQGGPFGYGGSTVPDCRPHVPSLGEKVATCHVCELFCPSCRFDAVSILHLDYGEQGLQAILEGRVNVSDVTSVFEQGAREALQQARQAGARTVLAAETGSKMRVDRPFLTMVSADVSTVGPVMTMREGMVVGAGGRLAPRAMALTSSAVASPFAPSSRQGAAMVLSSSRAQLFIVGGTLPGESRPTGEVWVQDVLTGEWLLLPFEGPRPQKVLAATYRVEDDSLWLFDEVQVGIFGVGRVVKVDLGTLKSDVVAAWPRLRPSGDVTVTNGPEGELVLTSGFETGKRHQVVVLEPGDATKPPSIAWALRGKGRAAGAAALTSRGLTVPVVGKGGVLDVRFVPSGKLPGDRARGKLGKQIDDDLELVELMLGDCF